MGKMIVKSREADNQHAKVVFYGKVRNIFPKETNIERNWYEDGIACYTITWEGELETEFTLIDGGELSDLFNVRDRYRLFFPNVNIIRYSRNDATNTSKYQIFIDKKTSNIITSNMDQINPSHYKQGKVECIDAIESATVGKTGIEAACTANVIKYLWRYEAKAGLVDVKKAKWYMERLLKFIEEKTND